MTGAPAPTLTAAERVMVIWIPDWPVHALRATAHSATPTNTTPLEPGDTPLALVAQHRIVACCARAREAGVRAGMRERDAQALCPALELHPHDPDRDARSFAPIVSGLEEVVTGVEARRPGLAALRARGPARYYGGEEPAAQAILARLRSLNFTNARIGISDGLFAAEQAARTLANYPGTAEGAGIADGGGIAAVSGVTIIPAGEAKGFLAPLPITRAASGPLAATLQGLGIHTLGAFAALPEEAVRQRFGGEGLAVHRRATAAGPQHGSEVRPRTPQRDFAVEADFEPPLAASTTLTEAATATVSRFFDALAEAALICTGLRLELTDDLGLRHERTWSHPSRFTREDVLDRVRWQAESGALGGPGSGEDRGGAGVAKLRITPTHTDRAHAAGLWGAEPDEHVRHHLRGIQVARGRDSIGTAALRGGRIAAERQQFSPWGSAAPAPARPAGLPWPGAAPAPSLVFSPPLPAALVDANGDSVRVDADDLLGSDPAHLSVRLPDPVAGAPSSRAPGTAARARHTLPRAAVIASWSAPWPLRERWWAGAPPRVRLQVVLDTGAAWLLVQDTGRWFAEGKYD